MKKEFRKQTIVKVDKILRTTFFKFQKLKNYHKLPKNKIVK